MGRYSALFSSQQAKENLMLGVPKTLGFGDVMTMLIIADILS